ncbi:MAG: NAD(P)/FAD-dependent oxidoreductase [Burkholderiaceae bacterium]|nr:NAD(P)/FAD-dependent oxidoreductase [Burkholderiaceae bacterium]MBP7661980.1 NAD(P)/FAD-dependent oxidoreductase [Burkholderiaceae bacterium]
MTSPGATGQATEWLAGLDRALAGSDIAAALALFGDECYWRDLVAFTWNVKTLEGRDEIAAMLRAVLLSVCPAGWRLDGEAVEHDGVVEAWLQFETAAGRGCGHLRLKNGRCWTLLTTLRELKGHEEQAGETRPKGVEHGVHPGRRSWQEERSARQAALGSTEQPYCLIVGGGQGGIALAARLKRLDVPALVVERHPRAGDSWRARYKSLCLHDPVWYDHLPYLPFPDHWPVFTPKDKMGDWLESYTRIMELDYWGGTECRSARYDDGAGEWVVEVLREGRPVTLRPRQLVLATGMSGMPEVPAFAGAERFRGEQMHSSAYRSGEAYRGKQCVVVGSNNSAHDICADLFENGATVTMLQRSSTLVARSETLMTVGWGKLFSESALRAGITTERADLTLASLPFKVMAQLQKLVYEQVARMDAPFYEGLRKAGFLLDFGEDGTGLSLKYMRRGSGYYIDVGASALIADGSIRLRSPVTVASIGERSVTLDDGSELPADLIVYATGYGSMSGWAARLISPQVAEQVGLCWGLGSGTAKDPGPWEGELRNMWKPTAHPGLWFHGGNLQQSRSFSLYLALQIKARQAGLATPVYGLGPVHHAG